MPFLLKTGILFWVLGLMRVPAFACLTCNRPLQVSVLEGDFWQNIFYMLIPFLLIGVIVLRIYKLK